MGKSVASKCQSRKSRGCFKGIPTDPTNNLTEAMTSYLADFVKQAAVVSVDWWDKLKPLRINTKGKKVPHYVKPSQTSLTSLAYLSNSSKSS